ncbi:DUF4397 domain-containing protein [Mucilaginibacter ximonensis]|uniref:DUF4397 domain-containing protein n=1 Tax=Mucilaginibacter ximonensis TaxID=538021 RepID=A0ABW5YBG0_9SPHI
MMKKLLILCLGGTVLLSACVKKKNEATGTTHVRFVNAISNSYTQDVYVDGALVYGGKLSEGAVSPYIDYTAGVSNIGIANTGTTYANISYSYGTTIGEYSTVFFFQDFNHVLVSGGIRDYMDAPPAGKARVRFVNLDNYSQTSFTMSVVGGANLFQSLVFATASPYYDVDPGAKFTATATGVVNPVTIDIAPVAGKIYTIWISATSTTDLQAHAFIQNYF